MRAWARALSSRDLGRACRLSDAPSQRGCIQLLRRAETTGHGRVIVERSHSSERPPNLYDVTGPTEISQVSVRRRAGAWRVHFEVQIIR